MKKIIPCIFLTALFIVALSPLPATWAGQDNKGSPQTSQVEPAKAKLNEAPVASKASAEKTTPKIVDNKFQKPKEDIRLGTAIVNVIVSVTDPYGRFVTGLGKDHFEVFDDKVKQQIAHFTDDDAPVSLGIVYDVSGSMKERVGRSIREPYH